MARRIATTFMTLSLFGCAATTGDPSSSAIAPVDYVQQIRPILETNCFQCHGSVQVPSGKLRLDSRAAALQGGRSGQPAIIPGKGNSSPLVISISGGDGERWRVMPPRSHGLRPEQVDLIRQWIDQGARFDSE